MVKKQSLIITIVLAVLIIVSAGVYIYVTYLDQPSENQPSSNNNTNTTNNTTNNTNVNTSAILTVLYNGSEWNYTLSELVSLDNYTGTGQYIKTKLLPDVVLGDLYEYTGVRIKTLLENIPSAPETYTITVMTSDNYTMEYTFNETSGDVDVYNSTGTVQPNQTAVMIIAYKENGTYYTEIDPDFSDIGPFRIAYVGDDSPITPSGLWTKMVTSIEINPQ
jgi:hypothetical protein